MNHRAPISDLRIMFSCSVPFLRWRSAMATQPNAQRRSVVTTSAASGSDGPAYVPCEGRRGSGAFSPNGRHGPLPTRAKWLPTLLVAAPTRLKLEWPNPTASSSQPLNESSEFSTTHLYTTVPLPETYTSGV